MTDITVLTNVQRKTLEIMRSLPCKLYSIDALANLLSLSRRTTLECLKRLEIYDLVRTTLHPETSKPHRYYATPAQLVTDSGTGIRSFWVKKIEKIPFPDPNTTNSTVKT